MGYYNEYEKFGDKLAFLDDRGQEITYSDLSALYMEIRNRTVSRKLVFCLCENSAGSAAGYLAFLRNGIVPLLLDRRIEQDLLDNLLGIYGPQYLWIPEDTVERFEKSTVLLKEYGYVLLKTSYEEKIALYDELALLLTTSGSTGSPKLVRQSYGNIQANADSIAEYLELTSEERPVTTLPMNYTYGLSIINSHINMGATVLMTDKTMAMKPFWDFMKKNKATSFGGVPFTYELLKKVKFFRMDLPDLRTMTQAGGKLSPELHKEFAEWAQEHQKRFVVMYGQTEATARMGYLPAEMSIEKYGSMGKAIPGGKFHLLNADEEYITEPEQVGELVYEGPNVTLGYAECREDLSKGDERNGILVTGDMAKMDADGYYYIVGRKKRFLKIFGNRVNLDETDQLIKKQFSHMECASTGVDDKMTVYITDKSLVDDVRRFLSAKTHLSESAFDVRYLEEIPKNEAGKILYNKLA